MRVRIIFLFVLILVVPTLLSGCINTTPPPEHGNEYKKRITSITISNSMLNYSEVLKIDKENVSSVLIQLGYQILNDSDRLEEFYLQAVQMNLTSNTPSLNVILMAFTRNNSTVAYFSLSYRPEDGSYPAHIYNETAAKQYMTEKSNQFGSVCNITTPWEFAEWSTTYAD